MSNALAIATVTATLRRNLQIAIDVEVSGAKVTTVRPDASGNGTPATGVNIYLYQITPNAHWRNADLPTRRSENRALIQQPRAALDLHYVLTFYGDETRLQSQHLAAIAARTLHTQPILTGGQIGDTLADPTFSFLAGSNLADEVETVKFTPLPLSLEELSRLWSVLFQTPYALSMMYQSSVVFVDASETPQPALPVRERRIYPTVFRQPHIETVQSAAGAGQGQIISSNSTLIISGQQLKGENTQIRIGDQIVPPQSVSASEIRLELSTASPNSLRAGVQALQVIQPVSIGESPHPGVGAESNVAAFVLCPTISVAATITTRTATDFGGSTLNACDGDVAVTFDLQVGQKQRVVLLLNEINAPTGLDAVAYSFKSPAREADATRQITVPVAGVREGQYLVRAQVDGAQSPLQTNASTGTFNGPQVVIV